MRLLAWVVVAATVAVAEPPKDQPVSATQDVVDKLDKAIAPLVAEARKTWPDAKKRWQKGLPKGHVLFVTVRLHEGDAFEQCFLRVKKVENGDITGTVANEIGRLKKVKEGDLATAKEAELYDWTIAKPDGTEEGNVVGKFLDTWKP
ncbi:MAG: DUF2314 domain-containing protein [Myxococcaceae bacterium]